MGDKMRGHFDYADTNNDNKVTRQEMQAHAQGVKEFRRMFEERTGHADR